MRCDTNPNLKTNAVLPPLQSVVSDSDVWNESSLDPKLPKHCVSNDCVSNGCSINTGPWGLSRNTQGFSNTLPNSIAYTRKGYAQGLLNFESACERIKARRYTPSYVFFEKDLEDGSTVIVKSKTAIRGNDVYRARVWNRHKELLSFCKSNDKISYIIPCASGGHTCNIIKTTLTVTPPSHPDGGWDRDEFNSYYMDYFYDLYVKRIRNAFPGVVVAKTLEVSTKKLRGCFHINVILMFPNHR
ncbi:unnamed protein product, partial [marine sediment metagenome]